MTGVQKQQPMVMFWTAPALQSLKSLELIEKVSKMCDFFSDWNEFLPVIVRYDGNVTALQMQLHRYTVIEVHKQK